MVTALVAALATSLPVDAGAAPVFAEVTARTGIDFVHVCGSREKDWIVEVNGSGVALFDFDGDGDLDIYFVNGSRLDLSPGSEPPRNALWRNDGGWRFSDVTAAAGVGDAGWGCGAAVADIDNDGDLDLYVANWGPNVLYRNRGDGTFERIAASGAEDAGWGAGACFADFDRDGLVDIYVVNYVAFDRARTSPRSAGTCEYKGVSIFCGPGGLEPAHDTLLLNRGGGRFRDAGVEWGVRSVAPAWGLGALVVDVQRDGWPDVVVANDTMANYCLVNDRGRGFREAALFLGLAYNDYGVAQAGMGLASGDIRGVGRDDVFVTNFEDDTNTLYLAGAERDLFIEGTYAAGLGSASFPYLGWGTFFFDAEGDGDLDLFVANGHVAPQMDEVRSSIGYAQRNQLFLNDGAGRFAELRDGGPGLALVKSSRGAACGDLDGDGDPDVVVSEIDARPTVLENRSAPAEWVAVRLRGTRSNRAGIGARVTLRCGGRRQERAVQSGMSFASQGELAARFAVEDRRQVEAIRVEWPAGTVEEFPGELASSAVVDLVEGEGSAVAEEDRGSSR